MSRFVARTMPVTFSFILALTGCQHTCCKPCSAGIPARFGPGAFIPPPVDRSIPSAPIGSQPVLQQSPVVQQAGPDTRNYAPPLAVPAQPAWGPPASSGARLQEPTLATPEPPLGSSKPQNTDLKPPPTPKSSSGEQPAASPEMPSGIPGFAFAREQVASGQKPLLDGFAWLKDNGYRAVLHLRQVGEDDAADRKQVEDRGMKYLSLEVSPQTLGQKVIDEFNRIVADAGNRPLFVYDRDGVAAGGLWYLQFRTIDRLSDEAARTKAAALGLKSDKETANRPM
jgi:protein tyrosine phosphatase (PTP) superfamily phosphohydrolase (DUF442 family)